MPVFYLDLKIWVLTFVGHQSRGIQLSFTLGIIKWYLLVSLRFFTNSLFTFFKKAQLSIQIEDVLCCLPCPGSRTLHGADGGESISDPETD